MYNSLAKMSEVGTLHTPSDAYVRSFLCFFSYFNKTATQKLLNDQANYSNSILFVVTSMGVNM